MTDQTKKGVYKKLQLARIQLQGKKLNKSGHNKFSGYSYFELGDFLPFINEIFNNLGLFSAISFTVDVATLRIIDVEDNSEVIFESPMGSISLKGCHDIQNIGAVQTYQRRYLYLTGLEIVEHDALDSVTGKTEKQEKPFLDKTNTTAWNNAKAAFKRDGNLDAVLLRMQMTEESKQALYEECDSV